MSVYVDDFKLVGSKDKIGPMWKSLMKTIDLEPPVALHNNVYLGCKQEPEKIDLSAVMQKSLIYQGFFMGKHAQDVANASRTTTSTATSNSEAPRKRLALDEKEIANPNTFAEGGELLERR